jgi:osmotically-inducible protein OsmY
MAQQETYHHQNDDRDRGERDRNLDEGSRQRGVATRDRNPVTETDQGSWTGYVVPYRYYGPGYRGVGYYSVIYQGAGDPEDEETSPGADQYGQRRGSASAASSSRGSSFGRSGSGLGGGHAGRGPKGYRRSDDRIKEDVSDLLTADDELDASEIEVDVRDAIVTLTGTVSGRSAKRRAEDVTERAAGVQDVMNQLRVQQSRESGPMGSKDLPESASASPSSRRTGSGQSTNGSNRTTAGSR